MFTGLSWRNQPASWSLDGEALRVRTDGGSDFWRETFYGFVRDSGHFYHREVTGDFTAEVTIVARFDTLYDQAGLMLRIDDRSWIKTGIEYTDGVTHLSAVLTRDYSDWSVQPYPAFDGRLRLRITRHGEAVRVQYLDPDRGWQLLRLGYLPMPASVQVGVMCCSPERAGFDVRFESFTVGDAIARDLHA